MNDVIDRVRALNPVPTCAAPSIADVWHKLDYGDDPAVPDAATQRSSDLEGVAAGVDLRHNGRARARRRAAKAGGRLAVVGSVLVVITVAAVVLGLAGHRAGPIPTRHVETQPPVSNPSKLAIFQRPQTARDRSMPAVVRRVGRLTHASRDLVRSILSGDIASSTRYTQTLPDGREVFLTKIYDPRLPHPLLEELIVAPNGSWRRGQPLLWNRTTVPSNRIARILALNGGDCSINNGPRGQAAHSVTMWNIEPNGVARVRWEFDGLDDPGQGAIKPVTIDVPVRGNTAVATIPGGVCGSPTAITLYAANGTTIASSAPHQPRPGRYTPKISR